MRVLFHSVVLVLALGLVIMAACSSGSGGASGTPDGGHGSGSAACLAGGANTCPASFRCDPSQGCVQCLADSECARYCVEGLCVVCMSNADCPSTFPACWPGDHACHPLCTSNADCPTTAPSCDVKSGHCVGCITPGPCGTTGRGGGTVSQCDPATQECVPCLADSDCPSNDPRCLAGLQTTQSGYVRTYKCGCTANADCSGSTPVCDSTTLTCRAGCLSDADCGGFTCDKNSNCTCTIKNGAEVPVGGVAATAPVPAGGTVADGTYLLTAVSCYNGPGGSTTMTGYDLPDQLTLSAGTFQNAAETSGGGVTCSSGAYTSGASTFTLNTTFPAAGSGAFPYDSDGATKLTLYGYSSAPCRTPASVFTKQ